MIKNTFIRNLTRFLIVMVMFLILVPGCLVMYSGNTGIYKGYSTGSRAGHLVKVSRKGLFYKSYECELQLVDVPTFSKNGVNHSTDDVPFGYWEFSTTDEELGKRLESVVGKNVKVQYTQYLIKPISLSTDYSATAFDVLE